MVAPVDDDRGVGDEDPAAHASAQRVTVDTTVQPKAVAFPTDARLFPEGPPHVGPRSGRA